MKWQFEISDCPADANLPVVAYQVNDSGVKRGPYYYSIENLKSILSYKPTNLLDADDERGMEISTPALPVGTIRYSGNKEQTRERVTMEIPSKQWEIRYGNEMEEFYTVGFPRMVVQYLVIYRGEQKVVNEMRIYSVLNDGKPITDETELYHFPYPNVGKSNAIVCWGGNQRLEIQSLVDLERGFRWFVDAPFGEDHGTKTTFGIHNFRRLLEKVVDKPFDDEWLVPQGKKFGELYKL